MKKLLVCLFVVMISVGVVAVMGGCGGGGGGGGLPKSPADYEGPGNPAVMDTTTAPGFAFAPWQLADVLDLTSLSVVIDSTETVEGSISGTATWRHYVDVDDSSATKYLVKEEYKTTYDNYRDETGEQWGGVLAGDGSYYSLWKETVKTTGEEILTGAEVIPQTVGEWVTWRELWHDNYSDFYESGSNIEDGDFDERTTGWITWEYNWVNDSGLWNVDIGANAAHSNYIDDVYEALLNVDGSLAWDGSVSTYAIKGTACTEGEEPDGCFDFDFSIFWDYDIQGVEDYPTVPTEDYPAGGTAEYSTANASIMVAFGSSPSNLTCYLLSLDADGNGSYAGTDDLDGVEICEPE